MSLHLATPSDCMPLASDKNAVPPGDVTYDDAHTSRRSSSEDVVSVSDTELDLLSAFVSRTSSSEYQQQWYQVSHTINLDNTHAHIN